MIIVIYVIDKMLNGTYVKKDVKLTSLPSEGEKLHLKDLELTVKETIPVRFFVAEFYVVRIETIMIENLQEFCKKYGFEIMEGQG